MGALHFKSGVLRPASCVLRPTVNRFIYNMTGCNHVSLFSLSSTATTAFYVRNWHHAPLHDHPAGVMHRFTFRTLDKELSMPEISQLVCSILEEDNLSSSPLLSSHPPDRASANALYVYKIGHPPRNCAADDWGNDGWRWRSNSNAVIPPEKLTSKVRQMLGDNQELRIYKWHCDKKVRQSLVFSSDLLFKHFANNISGLDNICGWWLFQWIRRAVKIVMRKEAKNEMLLLSTQFPFVFVFYFGDNSVKQSQSPRTFKSVLQESTLPLVRPSSALSSNLAKVTEMLSDPDTPISLNTIKRFTLKNRAQLYHARHKQATNNLQSPLENLTSGESRPYVLEAIFAEGVFVVVFCFKPALANFIHFLKRKRSIKLVSTSSRMCCLPSLSCRPASCDFIVYCDSQIINVDGTFGYTGMNLLLASCRDPRLVKGPPMMLYGALHKTKEATEYMRIFVAVKLRFPELFLVCLSNFSFFRFSTLGFIHSFIHSLAFCVHDPSCFPSLQHVHMVDEEASLENALRSVGAVEIRKCLRHISETEKRALKEIGAPEEVQSRLIRLMKATAYAETSSAFESSAAELGDFVCSLRNTYDPENQAMPLLLRSQCRRIEERFSRFMNKIKSNGAHTYEHLGIPPSDVTNNVAESLNNRVQQAVMRSRYRCDTLVRRITALMEQDERERQIFFWLGGKTRDVVWTAAARALERDAFVFPIVPAKLDDQEATQLLQVAECEQFEEEEEEVEVEERRGGGGGGAISSQALIQPQDSACVSDSETRRAVSIFQQQKQEQEAEEEGGTSQPQTPDDNDEPFDLDLLVEVSPKRQHRWVLAANEQTALKFDFVDLTECEDGSNTSDDIDEAPCPSDVSILQLSAVCSPAPISIALISSS